MKRGERPDRRAAIVNSICTVAMFVFACHDRDPSEFAVAFAFFVIGPLAWFVGRP